MAVTVKEIMNKELFALDPEDSAAEILNGLLAMGVTGAPVIDGEGHPLGVVSLRDLATHREGTARDAMHSPATTVRLQDTIAAAGRRMAETGYHRLVAVDEGGHAVGVVSTLDVIRGLLGLPAIHPASFPHQDSTTGLVWSDDQPLELDALEGVPDGPGILVLVHGGAGRPETPVWIESCENLYARLTDMLATPQPEFGLSFALGRRPLRYRVAPVDDPKERRRLLTRLERELYSRHG